jgi:flagellar protein FliS
MKNAYSTYKTANIDTADQGKLILIAYDVAIRNCRSALEIFNNKAVTEERVKYLYKAQDAVTELMSSLRLDAGDIAKNLYRLYDYMLWRIINSNTKNQPQYIEEVVKYLVELREAWVEAIAFVRVENREGIANTTGVAISG